MNRWKHLSLAAHVLSLSVWCSCEQLCTYDTVKAVADSIYIYIYIYVYIKCLSLSLFLSLSLSLYIYNGAPICLSLGVPDVWSERHWTRSSSNIASPWHYAYTYIHRNRRFGGLVSAVTSLRSVQWLCKTHTFFGGKFRDTKTHILLRFTKDIQRYIHTCIYGRVFDINVTM
jgi:hypothetical protein